MQRSFTRLAVLLLFSTAASGAQGKAGLAPGHAETSVQAPTEAPLPDTRTFLLDVERNASRMDALRKDYTYHVHVEKQELDKGGGVKKAEVEDSESVTVRGIRVDRLVARNGVPLTPKEQAKESDRIDKDVTKAQERLAKAANRGQDTDDRGDTVLSVARILQLGTFSNERRIELEGRPTIVLDYAGDPNAKTRSQPELIMRDLVGTVWIDEADRVVVKAEMRFLYDFKIAGGLVADVHKGTGLQFEAKRVDDAVWLPASIYGQGSIRVLLFAGFNGRLKLITSDYRRFHTSATILAGQSRVDANGNALPASISPGSDVPGGAGPSPPLKPAPENKPQL